MRQESVYKLKEIEQINEDFSHLPIGVEYDVWGEPRKDNPNRERIDMPRRKMIVVDGKPVSIMSNNYKTVQHKEAFYPIREGLAMRNLTYQYSLWATPQRAKFAVYLGEAEDGVKFGFRCINSFDGTKAINYGFQAYRRIESLQIVEKEHVLVWGFRQVCSNGMIMKVPLKTCKYLDAEKIISVKTLLSENARIIHKGDVNSKLETIQHIVEAFTLLKDPLNRMIIDAKNYQLSQDEARELIMKYVGRRKLDKYLEEWQHEEATLWGLYNSLTYIASHYEMTDSKRENLLKKASNLLEETLIAE